MFASREGSGTPRQATRNALAAVALWSTVATAFKLTLQRVSPEMLVAGAATVSAVVFAGWLSANGGWREFTTWKPRHYAQAAGLGLLNPCLYYLALFAAYDRLLAQEALVLNYTWPIALSVLSVPLLGQRLRARAVAGLLLSFGGVLLLATRGSMRIAVQDGTGLWLALGSAVVWAGYWIGSVRSPTGDQPRTFVAFACGALAAWIWAAARGIHWPDPLGWLGIAYAGLFEMGITFLLWMRALRLADSSAKVAQLVFVSPFISLGLVYLVLREPLHLSSLAGMSLVVAGIVCARQRSGGPSPT